MSARQSKYSKRRPAGTPAYTKRDHAQVTALVNEAMHRNYSKELDKGFGEDPKAAKAKFEKHYEYGVFIDDERNPEDVNHVPMPNVKEWKVVRTIREFCLELDRIENNRELYTDVAISFDYYLTGRETGQQALERLIFHKDDCTPVNFECFYHSSDALCRSQMAEYKSKHWNV